MSLMASQGGHFNLRCTNGQGVPETLPSGGASSQRTRRKSKLEEELKDGSPLLRKEKILEAGGAEKTLPYSSAFGTFKPSALPLLCSNLTSDRGHRWSEPVRPKSPWGKRSRASSAPAQMHSTVGSLRVSFSRYRYLTHSVDHVSGTALRASHTFTRCDPCNNPVKVLSKRSPF